MWSALWVAWLIVAGVPLGATAVAVVGFIVLSGILLRMRDQRSIEDWERRKREAEALEALHREGLESRELEREAAELEGNQDRR